MFNATVCIKNLQSVGFSYYNLFCTLCLWHYNVSVGAVIKPLEGTITTLTNAKQLAQIIKLRLQRLHIISQKLIYQ